MTIQRSFSWRRENCCERSYSGTPLSLETRDQNGELQRRALHFCLFFCPSLISCKFELLSRPIKLATLQPGCVSAPPAVTPCIFMLCILKFVTCRHGTSWKLKLLKECNGYNSYIDAEKELNSFISGRSCKKRAQVVTGANVDRMRESLFLLQDKLDIHA